MSTRISEFIKLDGSYGEGGGQILRTACALSVLTGKPFEVENVRAGRKNPGLQRQHLTAVQAAGAISGAEIVGAKVGSTKFSFTPSQLKPGEYVFDIGTAGSTMLVLQTILPPLMTASTRSRIVLEGGTHNPMAPPFEFIQKTFLPLLRRMGPAVAVNLDRMGFYPAGGGKLVVEIEPVPQLIPLHLEKRGEIISKSAQILLVKLPAHIGQREIDVLRDKLGLGGADCQIVTSADSLSPGNVVSIFVKSESLTEVITSIGAKGITAEAVAEQAARETRDYLKIDAPVGEHLADQLLIPMTLAGEGSFRTGTPSEHTTTNMHTIKKFLDVEFTTQMEEDNLHLVKVRRL